VVKPGFKKFEEMLENHKISQGDAVNRSDAIFSQNERDQMSEAFRKFDSSLIHKLYNGKVLKLERGKTISTG